VKKALIIFVVFTVIIGMVVGFSFTGCKSSTTTETTTTVETTAAAETTVAETTTGGPVKLLFYWWGAQEFVGMDEWMAKTVDLYHQQHPNITVETVLQNADTLYTAYRAAAEAGEGPDIGMMWGGIYLFEDVWKGNVEPIDKYFSEDELKNFIGLDATIFEGKHYGIPWANAMYVWAYNKTLFKQAGLDPDSFPNTWDDFMSACKALKSSGVAPIGFGTTDGYEVIAWADLIMMNLINHHYEILEPVIGKDSYTSAKWLKFFNYVKEITPYVNNDALSLDFYKGLDLLPQGKVAMTISTNGVAESWIRDGTMTVDELGLSPGFKIEAGSVFTGTLPDTRDLWVLTPWSKNKQEAANFIKFMNTQDRINDLYKTSSLMPSNKEFDATLLSNETEKKLYDYNVNHSEIEAVLGFTPTQIQFEGFAKAFESIINGSITPEQAVKMLEETAKKWGNENPEMLAQYTQWYEDMKSRNY
jgi:ABC-type glycerol-3-phosphate transport system substrate-binding protein